MQVFLPHADYHRSTMSLDESRLGNQIWRECWTLVNWGWPHHIASKLWRDHFHSLCTYALAGVDAMEERKWYDPTVRERWRERFLLARNLFEDTGPPPFVGDERVHSTYRANLLAWEPEWYRQFGWTERPTIVRYWPALS